MVKRVHNGFFDGFVGVVEKPDRFRLTRNLTNRFSYHIVLQLGERRYDLLLDRSRERLFGKAVADLIFKLYDVYLGATEEPFRMLVKK